MALVVAHIATSVKPGVALQLNDITGVPLLPLRSMQVERIHKGKTPRRIHYIAEWAARRQLKQADVVRELGADKGTVSRWFAGALPEQPYLFRLAALFGMEEPNELFHHPDDNWMSRFLQGKSMDEIRRLRQMIEAAFPPKTGTDG